MEVNVTVSRITEQWVFSVNTLGFFHGQLGSAPCRVIQAEPPVASESERLWSRATADIHAAFGPVARVKRHEVIAERTET